MKTISLLLSICAIGFISCGSPDPTSSQPKEIPLFGSHIISASMKAFLFDTKWIIEGAVAVSEDYKLEPAGKRWVKLNKDMTFDSGISEVVDIQGEWTTIENTNENLEFIWFKTRKNAHYFVNQWKIQRGGDVIILLGNSGQNQSGGQMKWIKE